MADTLWELTDFCRRHDNLTIRCGSIEYLRYWIGEQYPMREAASPIEVNTFCGISVSILDDLPTDILVFFQGGLPVKQFRLDAP